MGETFTRRSLISGGVRGRAGEGYSPARIATYAVLFAMVVSAVVLPSQSAYAAVVSQTDGTASTYFVASNPGLSAVQKLGGNLYGTATGVILSLNASSSIQLKATLQQCDNSTYVSSSGVFGSCTNAASVVSDYFIPAGAPQTVSLSFTSSLPTVVGKFYYLLITKSDSSTYGIQVFGSPTDKYTDGALCKAGSSGTSCTMSALDMYFILNGATGGGQSVAAISNQVPTSGQVLSTGLNAAFSFSYYITSLYNRAGFLLTDNTASQSVDASYASTTITASGAGSYSSNFDLITGHNYTWTPYISDTSGVNPTIYGTPTFFFTGTNYSQYTPVITPVGNPGILGSLGTASSSSIVTQTGNSSTTAGTFTFNATTTACTLYQAPKNFYDIFLTRFPISYVCDAFVLVSEVSNGNGAGVGDAEYTLPFGKTLSNGSSTVKIIDRSAIANIQAVANVKVLMGNVIYFITALGVIGMAMSAI